MLRRLLPMLTLLLVFPMVALAQDDKDKDKDKDKATAKKDEPKKEAGLPPVAEAQPSGLPLAVYVANTDPNQRYYYWGMLILIFFSAINAVCLILLRADIQTLRGGSNMSGS